MSRLKWFNDHIGKRLYRTNDCTCDVCTEMYKTGIIVLDNVNAQVMDEIELNSTIRFFETKGERSRYEKALPITLSRIHG